MRILGVSVVAVLLAASLLVSPARAEEKKVSGALDFSMKSIDGKDVDLSKYKGKVVLIVNVASKCGLTPQYKGLEELYETYGKEGLVILGFPANNFGAQEPGSDTEISEFCTTKYGVKFPMFSKISVGGKDKHPLYQFLTSKESNPEHAGEISWNFEKFLIGRDGKVVERFQPRVAPDSEEVVAAVRKELGKK